MESLRDKVVLITGASSGIGANTAVYFSTYGSKLALTGRNTNNLEQAAENCVRRGLARDKILIITADLTKDEELQKVIEETLYYFNRLDVLVNNAGMCIFKKIEEVSMEEVDHQLRTNLRVAIALSKLAIPHLKKTKGSIINVSSVCSKSLMSDQPIYCVSKAGLDMFTSSLAVELGKYGIRVNSVNPGDIKTPLFLQVGYKPDELEDVYKRIGETQYPLKRIGEAHEVAHPIAFLASDAASFVTGANLLIDGGVDKTSSWFSLRQYNTGGEG